ncbi:uncharacterized protein LOC128552491 [Mercenaria mercenaria]|uniref:uncharacterized protein LOC128552491 n=1 Tax=Mercenaria mercenaria TaxID=6596 RepID=UPI00234E89AC|nr:uncharacterized protein LOC128552491 [Mercenaria mercenaria]
MSCLKTHILLWFTFLLVCTSVAGKQQRSNTFTIQAKEDFTDKLIQGLRKLNFNVQFKITPSVYIFEYGGEKHTHTALKHVIDVFQDQIIDIEPTRLYKNSMKPVHGDNGYRGTANLVCSKYYGMSVTKVWERNITGKGVTIAVNDVGINTDLIDLEKNIDKKLSKNFLTGTADVTPETFPELVNKAPECTE